MNVDQGGLPSLTPSRTQVRSYGYGPGDDRDEKVLHEKFFYAPRVPPRWRSRKFSRKFVKKSYFANFSDAPDAGGCRELPVVKISALNDPWRYQKRQKNKKNKSDFFTILEFSFSLFLIYFGGARLVLASKSNSSRFFALDGQIFRSVRRLQLIL